jgi:hypothetical protein
VYYIALIAVLCLAAVVRALWQGARPQVVLFGADAAAALLNRLRRRLGL